MNAVPITSAIHMVVLYVCLSVCILFDQQYVDDLSKKKKIKMRHSIKKILNWHNGCFYQIKSVFS